MTLRAILLGFAGVAFICGFSYFNDAVIHQTFLVGNNMPFSIYGIFILFVLGINPLIRLLSRGLQLSRKEIVIILTLTLVSCCIPGAGLLRTFTNSIILPHQSNKTEPGWKEQRVIETVPKKMLVDVSKNESDVLNGFIQGMGTAEKHISFSDVPWYAWKQSLMFWLPLILSLWIALIALSLVVHKQWSAYEHLPYPIASFTNSLLPDKNQSRSSIFKNKLFWLGAILVFAIHINNYAYTWFPKYLLKTPTTFDFTPFLSLSKAFRIGGGKGGGQLLMLLKIYFSVIGISYFLTTDVSLSLGIGPLLYNLAAGMLIGS